MKWSKLEEWMELEVDCRGVLGWGERRSHRSNDVELCLQA